MSRFTLALFLPFILTFAATLRAGEPEDIFKAAERLERGVNLGDALEAPREGEWGLTLKAEYFAKIARAGLRSVRIPISWSSHAAAKPPYTIDPKFFERIDWAVDQALANKLSVVINVHHYGEMDSDPESHLPRLVGLWKQIATHFRSRPAEVMFELLNEPHDKLTDELWNPMIPQLLGVIRETNPGRAVIVGPGHSNSVHNLEKLKLPAADRRLIVTFHYYEPFHFTHQSASWVPESTMWKGETWRGTEAQVAVLTKDFDEAAAWAKSEARPLYLGEFGAYEEADFESRVTWTRAVAQAAAQRGIPACYWEFGGGFGVFDRDANRWRDSLLQALLKNK